MAPVIAPVDPLVAPVLAGRYRLVLPDAGSAAGAGQSLHQGEAARLALEAGIQHQRPGNTQPPEIPPVGTVSSAQ